MLNCVVSFIVLFSFSGFAQTRFPETNKCLIEVCRSSSNYEKAQCNKKVDDAKKAYLEQYQALAAFPTEPDQACFHNEYQPDPNKKDAHKKMTKLEKKLLKELLKGETVCITLIRRHLAAWQVELNLYYQLQDEWRKELRAYPSCLQTVMDDKALCHKMCSKYSTAKK